MDVRGSFSGAGAFTGDTNLTSPGEIAKTLSVKYTINIRPLMINASGEG